MKVEDLCEVKNDPGIYYLYDTLNKKYFIGQSIRIKNKLEKFLNIKNANAPIELAIKNNGIENFEFKILDYVNESNYAILNKKLNELEIQYIEQFNSKLPNGYNPIIFNNKVQKIEDNLSITFKECNYYINVSTGHTFISSMDDINYILIENNESKEQYIQISKEDYNLYKEGLKQVILNYVNTFINK